MKIELQNIKVSDLVANILMYPGGWVLICFTQSTTSLSACQRARAGTVYGVNGGRYDTEKSKTGRV